VSTRDDDPNVHRDVGGWISGSMLPAPTALEVLRAAYPGWTIEPGAYGLPVFTAERRSHGGRALHYLVAPTAAELAEKLAVAETAGP
jgi:hypothetical protein